MGRRRTVGVDRLDFVCHIDTSEKIFLSCQHEERRLLFALGLTVPPLYLRSQGLCFAFLLFLRIPWKGHFTSGLHNRRSTSLFHKIFFPRDFTACCIIY